jgi:thioredoxin-dependent peroxiredoxin
MVNECEKAPAFSLKDEEGKIVKLNNFKDKILVLYFYPRDNTSGCTKEACNIRDNLSKLKNKNVEVLGVSNDHEESHKKFKNKHELNFPLLVDEDKEVSKKYGVYVKKNMYGREYFGLKRTTFIIEKGIIKKIIDKVKVGEHAEQILEII